MKSTLLKNIRSRKGAIFAFLFIFASCTHYSTKEIISPQPKINAVKCVAVLPFENLSGFREAGSIIADLLATELYATRMFNVMERFEAVSILRARNIKNPVGIDINTAQKVGKILGVEGIFFGAVSEFSYGDIFAMMPEVKPSVVFICRLVDVKSGKTIWASAQNVTSGEASYLGSNSISRVAQLAAQQIISSLTRELSFRKVDINRVCWEGKVAPLPAPSPPTVTKPNAPPPPRKARISILNASGADRLEEKVARALLVKDIDVVTVSIWPGGKTFGSTTIYFLEGYRNQALTIGKELPKQPRYLKAHKTKMGKDIEIAVVIGKDLIKPLSEPR